MVELAVKRRSLREQRGPAKVDLTFNAANELANRDYEKRQKKKEQAAKESSAVDVDKKDGQDKEGRRSPKNDDPNNPGGEAGDNSAAP